jgi:hypothetical protein
LLLQTPVGEQVSAGAPTAVGGVDSSELLQLRLLALDFDEVYRVIGRALQPR